ncbi:hypothetical protein C7M84_015719 [Penaeus vannamei]|uniref:Uncharacterized protein n=1 Tax=Penaeus vannamei TaxID=6689 RepID=A0A423SPX0_PENVA|nr:hypothetical protein C7M84_015719 [Penaeus vannamei]
MAARHVIFSQCNDLTTQGESLHSFPPSSRSCGLEVTKTRNSARCADSSGLYKVGEPRFDSCTRSGARPPLPRSRLLQSRSQARQGEQPRRFTPFKLAFEAQSSLSQTPSLAPSQGRPSEKLLVWHAPPREISHLDPTASFPRLACVQVCSSIDRMFRARKLLQQSNFYTSSSFCGTLLPHSSPHRWMPKTAIRIVLFFIGLVFSLRRCLPPSRPSRPSTRTTGLPQDRRRRPQEGQALREVFADYDRPDDRAAEPSQGAPPHAAAVRPSPHAVPSPHDARLVSFFVFPHDARPLSFLPRSVLLRLPLMCPSVFFVFPHDAQPLSSSSSLMMLPLSSRLPLMMLLCPSSSSMMLASVLLSSSPHDAASVLLRLPLMMLASVLLRLPS